MIVLEYTPVQLDRKEVRSVDMTVPVFHPNHPRLIWGTAVTVTITVTVYNLGDPVRVAEGRRFFGYFLKPGAYRGYRVIVLHDEGQFEWIVVYDPNTKGSERWKGAALNIWNSTGVTIYDD